MMLYQCKNCGKEIKLLEIDFMAKTFCQCGSMEMSYIGVSSKGHEPAKKDTLSMIIEGVRGHYKAA